MPDEQGRPAPPSVGAPMVPPGPEPAPMAAAGNLPSVGEMPGSMSVAPPPALFSGAGSLPTLGESPSEMSAVGGLPSFGGPQDFPSPALPSFPMEAGGPDQSYRGMMSPSTPFETQRQGPEPPAATPMTPDRPHKRTSEQFDVNRSFQR
jgi:hypothetical protein